jgi:2-polyprenyl-6-methoxyphenol hydroxylase-like FAD-dependent oxidoreductase
MKIVIPGGSGQVGTILARAFHAGGHDVVVLSRRPHPSAWRFSIDVAHAWERTFAEAACDRTRKVVLRSAMTLSPDLEECSTRFLRSRAAELILKSRRVVPRTAARAWLQIYVSGLVQRGARSLSTSKESRSPRTRRVKQRAIVLCPLKMAGRLCRY